MFKINVRVKTGTSQEKLEMRGSREALIWIQEKPVEGKANEAVIRILAKHFGVKRGAVVIKAGLRSKEKLIEIHDKD